MITLGDYSYNASNDIDCYEGVNLTFGKFCSIGSGLKIYSGIHPCNVNRDEVSTYPFQAQYGWDATYCKTDGFVRVGNDVWIATDVGILEGVTIGDGAIIGARAMVTKDVPPYAFVAGNPAEIKNYRFGKTEIEKLLKLKWWDWSLSEIEDCIANFSNIDLFLSKYNL
jgi:acetyltransferase-like isoleucine patch superfamily enzyme